MSETPDRDILSYPMKDALRMTNKRSDVYRASPDRVGDNWSDLKGKDHGQVDPSSEELDRMVDGFMARLERRYIAFGAKLSTAKTTWDRQSWLYLNQLIESGVSLRKGHSTILSWTWMLCRQQAFHWQRATIARQHFQP
eukprot:4922522-Amphidinium_carterae.1